MSPHLRAFRGFVLTLPLSVSAIVMALAPMVVAPAWASPMPLSSVVAAPAPSALPPLPPQDDPWLYRGSDIPHDKEWIFGTLPNGLRWAVRKNGVPPGQVSIRIRMDVGSLYEQPQEAGFRPSAWSIWCFANRNTSAKPRRFPTLAAARRDLRYRH